jgi:hypothetical protein
MLLNTTGDMWTSTNGWLSTALAGKQNTGSYLTAESDTLATVTGRGATTGTASSFTGGLSASTLGLTGDMFIRNSGPTIHFVDSNERGAALHNNSNLLYILSSNGIAGESWTTNNGEWPFYINVDTNAARFGGTVVAAGAISASNLSGTNTGDNPGVTAVAGVTPIVSSGGTTPSISHATSGATAGTYNNVTVNTFGHVTAGSNTAYLTALSDTLATVTARGATTGTASSFTGGLSVTGLTVSKSGTDSIITFPAHTNDPGYIKHYENANAAIMYFSVSDDTGAADYFSFGSTPGGTYTEGLRLTAGGVVSVGTWQATSISTTYTDAKITSIAATSPIVTSAATGAITLSHAASGVSAGTYNNVTVNATGHVTAGSNAGYLTGESDTLATVTARGASTSTFVVFKVASTVDINAANDTGSFSVRGDTTYPASISFHRAGAYAINMGLSTANEFVIGGWSASSNAFKLTGAGAGTFLSTVSASNFSGSSSGTNTGDNPGVTSVAGVTPIVSSGGTTPSISHATSGATAGTYNNVTVNTFGHVTAGSNVGYTSNTGTVTGVTATAPVVSSGGTAPVISMAAATTSVNGYLTAANWTTFNNKQAAGTYLSSSNYTSYSPTLTGGSASGLWGINITGSAVTLAHSYGRTDATAYPVMWGTTTTTTQLYSCAAVTITSSTGTLSASILTATSDIRVKTNIKKIDNALEKVMQLRGVTYDRTDIEAPRQTGVIAQEVLKVLPEAVTGSEETQYGVAYGNMVGLLIEAIKEQQTIIDSQESRIAKLEALINKLID